MESAQLIPNLLEQASSNRLQRENWHTASARYIGLLPVTFHNQAYLIAVTADLPSEGTEPQSMRIAHLQQLGARFWLTVYTQMGEYTFPPLTEV